MTQMAGGDPCKCPGGCDGDATGDTHPVPGRIVEGRSSSPNLPGARGATRRLDVPANVHRSQQFQRRGSRRKAAELLPDRVRCKVLGSQRCVQYQRDVRTPGARSTYRKRNASALVPALPLQLGARRLPMVVKNAQNIALRHQCNVGALEGGCIRWGLVAAAFVFTGFVAGVPAAGLPMASCAIAAPFTGTGGKVELFCHTESKLGAKFGIDPRKHIAMLLQILPYISRGPGRYDRPSS